MTLRRIVVLCFLLVLSVSLFLPAAAQTDDTPTPTVSNETGTPTNDTPVDEGTPVPTPVSDTGAIDLRVSIGDTRVVEGMLFERTSQPTIDIEAISTESIRLVAVRKDNERIAEYRPGGLSFEQRLQPDLENERNQIRIIVQTNTGATESLSFNYTYDTRGPWLKHDPDQAHFNDAGSDRVVFDNGTVFPYDDRSNVASVAGIPDGLVYLDNSPVVFTGSLIDSSGTKSVEFNHEYPRFKGGGWEINRTPWTRNFSGGRTIPFRQPIFAAPATIHEVDMEFRDELDNVNNDGFFIMVDDDQPPQFNVQVEDTDRNTQLERPTVPDADIEMVDDSTDGKEALLPVLRATQESDGDDVSIDDSGDGGDAGDGETRDFDIPGSGNERCSLENFPDRLVDGEYDDDVVPDEYSLFGGRAGSRMDPEVKHPIPDHLDFNPDVYGQHYCQDGGARYFGNPDWPFAESGPYTGENLSDNEVLESESIQLSDDNSVDTYYNPNHEDEDNDQAINVDLEEAPRDSTASKQIRVTGTVSDNAQLRRVTIRVGWHPKNITSRRGLETDSSGVVPFRSNRNLSADVDGLTDGQIRNWFDTIPGDSDEDSYISCSEEDNNRGANDYGEVGPMGPDNDPGGTVQVCPDSIEPIKMYSERQVLAPSESRELGAQFQTIRLNETIPLKNRTGETITNVVEVEAQDFQGHEQRRLAIVEKEPLQPEPIIDIDPQRTRTTNEGRLNIAARVFDGLVHTVTVETRQDGSIYDFAEAHNGSTRSDIRVRETLDRPRGPTTVLIRAVDIRGRVHTETLRLDAIRTETPTETPFQTEEPEPIDPDTVEPPEPDTPLPTDSSTPTRSTPTPAGNATTPTPSADRGAVFGDNFGFAAVAIALLSVAALARRRLV
jgi:hypothetical protein